MPEGMPTYYYGRKWDAPFTDDAIEMDRAFVEMMLATDSEATKCSFCQEKMTLDDDLFLTPYNVGHLECHIRPAMGDVQHLEGRCICSRGTGGAETLDSDHYDTYRESAKATLQWLINHNRGRFHDSDS